VVKGFQQVHGINYDETFAPVEKMDSIWLALAIVAPRRWEVHQLDVKNEFLHNDLKQGPRAWYAKMDSYILSQSFGRSKSDPIFIC
jgi:hypothetical protein